MRRILTTRSLIAARATRRLFDIAESAAIKTVRGEGRSLVKYGRQDMEELLEASSPEEIEALKRSIAFDPSKETLTADLLTEITTPTLIGPTWKTTEDGSWLLPEHTLGWEIAGWCTKYLKSPRNPEEPFKFTLEQLRFILHWYAVDAKGKFLYRTGVLQRMKGAGKLRTLYLQYFASLSSLARLASPTGTRMRSQ